MGGGGSKLGDRLPYDMPESALDIIKGLPVDDGMKNELSNEITKPGYAEVAWDKWLKHKETLRTPEEIGRDEEISAANVEYYRKQRAKERSKSSEPGTKRRKTGGQEVFSTKDGRVEGNLLGPSAQNPGQWTIQTDKGKIDVERPETKRAKDL